VYSLEYTEISKVFHIMGDDVSRATKAITNVTVTSKVTMLSKVTVEIVCSKVIAIDERRDRHRRAHKMLFA
jgi:hypothetical protein